MLFEGIASANWIWKMPKKHVMIFNFSALKRVYLLTSTVKIKWADHVVTSYRDDAWYNFQKKCLVSWKILNKNVALSSECFWSPKTKCSVLTNQQCLFILPKSFQLKYSQCAIITESLSAFSSDNSIIRAMKGLFLLMISPSNISSSYSAFQLPRMHCSITVLKLTVCHSYLLRRE